MEKSENSDEDLIEELNDPLRINNDLIETLKKSMLRKLTLRKELFSISCEDYPIHFDLKEFIAMDNIVIAIMFQRIKRIIFYETREEKLVFCAVPGKAMNLLEDLHRCLKTLEKNPPDVLREEYVPQRVIVDLQTAPKQERKEIVLVEATLHHGLSIEAAVNKLRTQGLTVRYVIPIFFSGNKSAWKYVENLGLKILPILSIHEIIKFNPSFFTELELEIINLWSIKRESLSNGIRSEDLLLRLFRIAE